MGLPSQSNLTWLGLSTQALEPGSGGWMGKVTSQDPGGRHLANHHSCHCQQSQTSKSEAANGCPGGTSFASGCMQALGFRKRDLPRGGIP